MEGCSAVGVYFVFPVSESTAVCTFVLDPRGFVRATMHDGAVFEIEDARAALDATWRVAGEKRVPVLVDMRLVRSQSRPARAHFRGPEAAARLEKVALLVDSPLSRVMANFFIGLGEHSVPARLFTDERSACDWLLPRGS